MTALPRRFLRFAGRAGVVVLALSVSGCLLPAIPLLGELGPVLVAPFGPWMAILAVLATLVTLRSWRRQRGTKALFYLGLSGFALAGLGLILARQIGVSRENGATIDLVQTLGRGTQKDASLRPVTIAYTRNGSESLPLDVYRATAGTGPAPVLVYVHGGGWGAETLRQRQADYRWFAERGYLVVSIEYSLSSAQHHTWNVTHPQIGCALGWITANAARFGGDPSRLALWGESAGGNLVLNVAYLANAGKLVPSCAGVVPHIAATMALYPVIDVARMYHNPDWLIGRFGRMMTVNYTGGTPEQFPDRYAAVTPTTFISPTAPPTLLIVPDADHLVVPDAAYAFADRARAAGIETRLIRMPNAEHAFDLSSGSIGSQIVRQAMLKFLAEHGLKP